MKTSETFDLVASCIVAAYPKLLDVKRTIDNEFGGFRYASLDQITGMIRPVLAEQGLIAMHDFSEDDPNAPGLGVITRLLHQSGQWMESTPLYCGVELRKGMTHAQSLGSTITYLRRYSLSAFLGLTSEADDDARQDEHGNPEPTGKTRAEMVQSLRQRRQAPGKQGEAAQAPASSGDLPS